VRVLARPGRDEDGHRREQDETRGRRAGEVGAPRERHPAEENADRQEPDREVDDDRMVEANVGHSSR
jgi:hypothetical protein